MPEERTTQSDYLIKAENLSKTYGDFVAVNDVSFTVERGESFGLLWSKWRREIHHNAE